MEHEKQANKINLMAAIIAKKKARIKELEEENERLSAELDAAYITMDQLKS